MRTYIGAIEKEKDIFTVNFPDLPGCLAEGSTFEEACIEAQQALALYLSEAAARGIAIPTPADPSKLNGKELVARYGKLHAAITSPAEPGERERVNVIFDKNLLVAVDTAAGVKGENRSSFLEKAARLRLSTELADLIIGGVTTEGKRFEISGAHSKKSKNSLSGVLRRHAATGRLTPRRDSQSSHKAKG